jgi:methylphosphotriester-DNA--protein-cysteine methyltransferase
MANGKVIGWDADRLQLLKVYWEQGRGVKAICSELGCSPATVSHQRQKLGLPPRHVRHGRPVEYVKMHIDMPRPVYDAIRQAACRHGFTASAYVRMLLTTYY